MKYPDEKQDLIKDKLYGLNRKNKLIEIMIAILMLIGGIILVFRPIKGLIGLEYMVSGIFVVSGIFLIYNYFSVRKEDRLSLNIVNGILLTMLGVFYIFSTPIFTLLTFSLVFAVLSLCDGINSFIIYSKLKKSGADKIGFIIFTGILNILVSVFFIVNPFMMSLGMSIIIGVYFIVGGVSLLSKALDVSNDK